MQQEIMEENQNHLHIACEARAILREPISDFFFEIV